MHGIFVLGQALRSSAQYLAAFVFDPKIPFVCHPFFSACRFCHLLDCTGCAPFECLHFFFFLAIMDKLSSLDRFLFLLYHLELVSQFPTPTSFFCWLFRVAMPCGHSKFPFIFRFDVHLKIYSGRPSLSPSVLCFQS